ncbi:MAG: hypothetical protein AAF721_16765 [Myxococcota bacterium]
MAEAAVVDDPGHPALANAATFDFDGVVDATDTGFAVVIDDVVVTVEAGATLEPMLACQSPETFADCEFVSYQDNPVTLTFDPPIAAVGLEMRYSVGPFTVVVDGASGQELITDASIGWEHPGGVYLGATGLGPISTMTITSHDYGTYWDNLAIATDGATTGGTDLALTMTPPRAALGAGRPWPLSLTVDNLGPTDAAAVGVPLLLPRGATIDGAASGGTDTAAGARFDLGTLTVGSSAAASPQPVTPSRVDFTCDETITAIAVAQHDGGDPDPFNNIAVATATFDRSSAPATEDCTGSIDRDCDGLVGCMDSDCAHLTACQLPPSTAGAMPFPPTIPIIPEAEENPLDRFSDPFDIPAAPEQCYVRNIHGDLQARAAMCCAPRPCAGCENPSLTDWLLTCPPLDPNYKEAVPPVNGLGYGTTEAGQRIEYTVWYENIGGSNAHDVAIIDVLDEDLDLSTLEFEGNAVHVPDTRGQLWIDPELPPHAPRSVHYSVEVRADAPVGTRVHNHATIVFPDADPPTAIATNTVVHAIPYPEGPTPSLPDLSIAGCDAVGDGTYAVRIANHSLAFAYNARAKIAETPDDWTVTDDTCTFAHPSEPEPEIIGTVIPWATTTSVDTVAFVAPADITDPCSKILWEIEYVLHDGSITQTDGWGDGQGSGNGVDDDGGETGDGETDGFDTDGGSGGSATGNGDGGCACATNRRPFPLPAALLAMFGIAAIRRRS